MTLLETLSESKIIVVVLPGGREVDYSDIPDGMIHVGANGVYSRNGKHETVQAAIDSLEAAAVSGGARNENI